MKPRSARGRRPSGGGARADPRYLTVFTDTTVRYSAERWSFKVLPVDLGRRLPVVAVTLKHGTLTPAAQVFLESV
jgi:hypothetical protein